MAKKYCLFDKMRALHELCESLKKKKEELETIEGFLFDNHPIEDIYWEMDRLAGLISEREQEVRQEISEYIHKGA